MAGSRATATSNLVSHCLVLAAELQQERCQIWLQDRLKFLIFRECYAHLNFAAEL